MQSTPHKGHERQVVLTWDGNRAVLHLAGDLDVATAPQLRACVAAFFERTPGAALVIDLAEVTFVDSTTLGVLVGAIRMSEQTGSSVVIRNQAPSIQRVFELTGLDRLLG